MKNLKTLRAAFWLTTVLFSLWTLFTAGSGMNVVYVDWQNDLVVVVRWINTGTVLNEFIGKVLASIRSGTP